MAGPQSAAREAEASDSRVGRNFLALGGGEVVARLVAFGAYVYLARTLGAEGYGVIAFVGGIHLYLMKIAEFSLESVGSSRVAQMGAGVGPFVGAVLATRLLLTAATMVVCAGLSQVLLPEPERTVLQLYLLALVPLALNTKWVLLGYQRAAPVGLSRILTDSLFFAVVLFFVHAQRDLWLVPVGTLLGEAGAAVMLYLVLSRQGISSSLRWDLSSAWPIFRKATPLVAQIMLGLLIYNSDVVFLRAMRDGETVGYYAAAYMLLSFLGNVAISYGTSLIPALASEAPGSLQETRLYHNSLAQIFAVAMPVTIGGSMVAPGIIELWYGDGYGPAGAALSMLMWALPGTTFRVAPWAGLVVRSKEGMLLRATIVAVIVNALLNAVLISSLGMQGAALATITTETLTGYLMLRYAVLEGMPFLAPRRLLPPIAAGLMMAGVLYVAEDLPLFLRIAAGAATYGVGLVLLGALRFVGGRPAFRL